MLYFGLAVVYYTTVSQSLIQQSTPPELIGRVMSLFMLGTMGTTPLGGLIVGLVIDAADPRAALGLGAASLFACAGVIAWLARRHRAPQLRPPAHDAADPVLRIPQR